MTLLSLHMMLIFSSINLSAHDIHLSVTEIDASENKIEVVSKIFLDDLQISMNLIPGEELPEDYTNAHDLIQKFMDENFSIIIDGMNYDLSLKNVESALPAIWAYFEISELDLATIQSFEVVNNIMLNLYQDQKNIIKVNINGIRKEEILDKKNTKTTILF